MHPRGHHPPGQAGAGGAPKQIAAQYGVNSLEEAFVQLTGVRDTEDVARDLLVALQ